MNGADAVPSFPLEGRRRRCDCSGSRAVRSWPLYDAMGARHHRTSRASPGTNRGAGHNGRGLCALRVGGPGRPSASIATSGAWCDEPSSRPIADALDGTRRPLRGASPGQVPLVPDRQRRISRRCDITGHSTISDRQAPRGSCRTSRTSRHVMKAAFHVPPSNGPVRSGARRQSPARRGRKPKSSSPTPTKSSLPGMEAGPAVDTHGRSRQLPEQSLRPEAGPSLLRPAEAC